MHESFAFVDRDRRFNCRVEPARWPRAEMPHAESWWWFEVSTEAHGRFAPFRAAASDTSDAVRHRVVAYYDNLLARRAEPSRGRWQRGRVAAAPAATVATVDSDGAALTPAASC